MSCDACGGFKRGCNYCGGPSDSAGWDQQRRAEIMERDRLRVQAILRQRHLDAVNRCLDAMPVTDGGRLMSGTTE